MLNAFIGAVKVYIACGYTDLRKGIDGLARLVQQQFELDLFTNTPVSYTHLTLPTTPYV